MISFPSCEALTSNLETSKAELHDTWLISWKTLEIWATCIWFIKSNETQSPYKLPCYTVSLSLQGARCKIKKAFNTSFLLLSPSPHFPSPSFLLPCPVDVSTSRKTTFNVPPLCNIHYPSYVKVPNVGGWSPTCWESARKKLSWDREKRKAERRMGTGWGL